jgi:hypothetical protein
VPASSSSVAIFDYDGDGYPEFHRSSAAMYRGSAGSPHWAASAYGDDSGLDPLYHSDYVAQNRLPQHTALVSFLDVDGDGQLDRLLPVTGSRTYDILFGRPRSTPLAQRVWQTTIAYDPCGVYADVNGDGLPDVVHLAAGSIDYNPGVAAFWHVDGAFTPPPVGIVLERAGRRL